MDGRAWLGNRKPARKVMMKTCGKCGAIKKLDGFAANKSGKFGRHSTCKACMSAAAKASYKPEQRSASNAAYYESNKQSVLARTAAWAAANRDKTAGYTRAWRAKHPDRQRAATMSWRSRNVQAQAAHDRENGFRRRSNGYSPGRAELRAAIDQCKESYRIGDRYLDAYTMELIDAPTIDHVVPLSLGGANVAENFVVTSRRNNSSKRDQSMIMFLWRMADRRDHAVGAAAGTAI